SILMKPMRIAAGSRCSPPWAMPSSDCRRGSRSAGPCQGAHVASRSLKSPTSLKPPAIGRSKGAAPQLLAQGPGNRDSPKQAAGAMPLCSDGQSSLVSHGSTQRQKSRALPSGCGPSLPPPSTHSSAYVGVGSTCLFADPVLRVVQARLKDFADCGKSLWIGCRFVNRDAQQTTSRLHRSTSVPGICVISKHVQVVDFSRYASGKRARQNEART